MKKPHLVLFLLLCCQLLTTAQTNHNLEVGKQLDIFNNVYKNVDLLYVDTLNPEENITAAIKGMLQSLDPYTEYFPESESKNLEMMLTGKYAGMGSLVKYHLKRKRVVVDEPYEGSPSAEAGLKKGDIILAIDDSVMTDKRVDEVSPRLRGDAGTSFVLKILRPSTNKEMKMKITRRNIKMLPELPYYGILEDNIGYINFNQFTEGSAREVRRAFVDLKKQGARALVFDLRNNGGGSEMEAVDIVNLWIPKGQLVVENRGKMRQTNRKYVTRLEPVDTIMPIAILVNENTASASEITSGALQDLDRAAVIGTRTYGKGLVQIPLDMPYNSTVKITTAHYYIPSGRCIQAINYKRKGKERVADSLQTVFHTRGGRVVKASGGITPDIEVKNDTLPNIAFYLTGGGTDSTEVAFDYVVDYIARHETIAPAKDFRLSEQDWQEFRQRVIDNGFSYDPVSRKQFDALVKTAQFEGYYDEARSAFDALSEKLKHDVATDLDKHREIIQHMLELDIIAAYYYQRGTIEASLHMDKQVKEAIRLLKNEDEYRELLSVKKE